ncbi:dihydrofolate reductase family protein [Agromyces bauzanensis]|uniref:Riboflavin biosynthesis protein RibD n=1 Tax=Agromyces bauzanensis TaxID=1308924 RepID=A0A917PGN9_9MICO|nr:dihydrofolate reductase family protein [Agromyces bauzanensis]GGJ77372.1 riboflavin biosynthesis protein RibD [Agromyces bauzanensis]
MTENGRRVVVNTNVSIDGYYHGPGGPQDMGFVMPYAITDAARDHLTRLWEPATTALLGRTNAEGFLAYWPPVADQADADPRDRGYAAWLRDADKVVLSSTLTESPWERTRIFNEPAEDVVDRLKAEDGGDIVVFSSASVIKALLAADRVDRLSFMIFPEILGGGARMFEEGLPASKWRLATAVSGEHGAVALVYDRLRAAD